MTASRQMTLRDLLAGTVDVPASLDKTVSGICNDSRRCTPGCVFLACDGITSHGLDYIDQALRLGASAILWEPGRVQAPTVPEGIPVIAVEQLSALAGPLAARFHGDPASELTVIGVTGTNGKTSVAHLLANALDALGRRCAVAGTLGNGLPGALHEASHTTPDAVTLQSFLADMRDEAADCLAMEVSSHALSQHRVAGMNFNTAVFTNLSRDHLDYHGDLESYAAAKRRLFEMSSVRSIVVNADDRVGREILADAPSERRRIGFAASPESFRDIEVDFRLLVSEISFDAAGITVRLELNDERLDFRAPLFGRFNALNLVAVFGVLLALGFPPRKIVDALQSVKPVRGRMQHVGGGDAPTVIVDYAHTPDALRQVLLAAREHAAGKVLCMFGCGGDRDRGKRPEMAAIAEGLADRIVVTDDNPRTEDGDRIIEEILAGFSDSERVEVERDRAVAIRKLVASADSSDVVVLAGKGHEDYQIVGNERRHFSDLEEAQRALGEVA